jgi:hypothetical protein
MNDGGRVAVFDAEQVVVVDQPMWLQRNDCGPMVLAPSGQAAALADLLDLDLATERAAGLVTSSGTKEPVPAAVGVVLAGPAVEWFHHGALQVDGIAVDWWVDADGRLHANGPGGLSRALAWSAGRWRSRFLLDAVLTDPARTADLVADAAFD